MADTAKIESPDAEWMQRLAAAPDAVAAAFARGSQSLSTLPAIFPALTEPAVTFDPTAFTVAE